MNKKIIEHDEDFIENIRDLFSVLDYEPVLIRTGFDGNYLEYVSNGSNSLSFDEYLELIRPYLGDLINVYKTKGEWKLQLSAEISFVSQKPDSDEKRVMYTKSICEEFMIGSETEEITEKLIMSLLQKYQDNLQNKMRGSDFVFDVINCIYYDFNRITISKGGSYIESPKWLKDKKCTINKKNSDNMCFKYAATLALNLNKINKNEEFMIGSETEEITEKLIMSLLQKYQDNLQNKMRVSDFVFDVINCIYYDFNRITISKGGSYIESPKWLKDKKCTINKKIVIICVLNMQQH